MAQPKLQLGLKIGKPNPGKHHPKKDVKGYEFRIYTSAPGYDSNLELLTTIRQKFKDVFEFGGRPINIAKNNANEYVRNIGLFGITIEDPENVFNFYPPNRISKIEYNEIDD